MPPNLFKVSKKTREVQNESLHLFSLMGAKNFIDHTRNGSAYYVVPIKIKAA